MKTKRKKLDLVIEMNPADLAVNAAFRSGKDRRGRTNVRKSDRYADARARVGEAAMLRALELGLEPFSGPVSVTLRTFWGAREVDVDAPIKGALDALQDAGIYADDAQVITVLAVKARDPERPRIELEVTAG